MNKINIKITAPCGSGKTTVLHIIAKTLKEYGFTVDTIDDVDYNFEITDELITKRAEAISKIWSVELVTENSQRQPMDISTKQSIGRVLRNHQEIK